MNSLFKELELIASKHYLLGPTVFGNTMNSQGSDEKDLKICTVWDIKNALQEAYEKGVNDEKEARCPRI